MATSDRRELVCVVGPGRSGTSTMAGTLAHSGFHVPAAIKGNETNPSGFFEPRWVVNFHRRLLDRAEVRTLDADPRVLARLDRFTTNAKIRAELGDWLERELTANPRLVLKDPRMVWFRDLWVEVASGLGVDPVYVIMLRHPAEVSSSRSEYYNAREVPGVAGWINVALISEQVTHGSPRALVRYADLTADWRRQAVRIRDLGVELDPPPEQTPHPVDDFIDPKLTRMRPGWEHVAVPEYLQVLGDRTFDALGRLADHGESSEVEDELKQLREEYATLHEDALQLVNASMTRARSAAARKALRQARQQAEEKGAAPAPSGTPSGARRVWGAVSRRLGRG